MAKSSICTASDTSHEVEAGAPGKEEEIEATPEMIEAGLDELWNHNIMEPRHDEMRIAVASIYRVMSEARPEPLCRSGRSE